MKQWQIPRNLSIEGNYRFAIKCIGPNQFEFSSWVVSRERPEKPVRFRLLLLNRNWMKKAAQFLERPISVINRSEIASSEKGR